MCVGQKRAHGSKQYTNMSFSLAVLSGRIRTSEFVHDAVDAQQGGHRFRSPFRPSIRADVFDDVVATLVESDFQ
jgi:hypothetical protein